MIWLLCLCALLSVLWIHAEVGWCDERDDRKDAERIADRLRERNRKLADALWSDAPHPRLTRYVARTDAEIVDALLADLRTADM